MQFRVLHLVAFLSLFFYSGLSAQINPAIVATDILMDVEDESVQLFSYASIQPVDQFDHAASSGFNAVAGSNNFKLRYTPASGFTGVDRAVFECTESLFGPKSYITVEMHVSASIVTTANDYASVGTNGEPITISVLDNDYASLGELTLDRVEATTGGIAIQNGNQITFTPANDFTGIAQFSYIATDENGESSASAVFVNVVPSLVVESDTIYLTQTASSPFGITMPTDGYALKGDSPLFGALSEQSSFSFTYTPTLFSEGVELLEFENAQTGKKRFVEIQLINDKNVQLALRNDVAYTNKGQAVVINAGQNDYLQNGVVVDHSDELTYASGVFFYTPESQFEGVKQFYYTVHDGAQAHTAIIDVHVGNYMPQVVEYDFTTYTNTPLVLDYAAPIKGYSFNVVSAPANGTLHVNINEAGSDNCNKVTGYQMVSYTPNQDFEGVDHFTIEYCVTDGSCKEIKASVLVTAGDEESDCHCIGSDCVWAGDANGDGVVNVVDLLAVGYHYGESGKARDELASWGANSAESWGSTQVNGRNTNKVDANGDGLISAADTAAIAANYGNQDNFIAAGSVVDKAIPVSYTVDNPTPKPGDVVTIQIHLGSEDNPVVDLHGWATKLVLPAAWVDSSTSITFTPNQEWFGKGSPTISMAKNPTSNTLDLAMSRTVGKGISGFGVGGELRATIIQLIDPIRPAGDEIPVDFIFPSSVMTDGSGQQYRVDGGKVTVRYQLGDTYDDTESKIIGDQIDVLAYPNPTSGAITLHANNRDIITSVSLYDMLGRELYRRDAIGTNEHVIREPLVDGFYFAHITTEKGKAVQRIEVRR